MLTLTELRFALSLTKRLTSSVISAFRLKYWFSFSMSLSTNASATVRLSSFPSRAPIILTSFPETVEDVKIMGARERKELNLTVALAYLDKIKENEKNYFKHTAAITE